mmetsp:Transcript_1541/g.2304  ORF Transcript_1541/g.2304 Transcript_1541/m.2304 type:complete len:522 (+) Transcript_1541:36-1601(+)
MAQYFKPIESQPEEHPRFERVSHTPFQFDSGIHINISNSWYSETCIVEPNNGREFDENRSDSTSKREIKNQQLKSLRNEKWRICVFIEKGSCARLKDNKRRIRTRERFGIKKPFQFSHTCPFKMKLLIYSQSGLHKANVTFIVDPQYKIDSALTIYRKIAIGKCENCILQVQDIKQSNTMCTQELYLLPPAPYILPRFAFKEPQFKRTPLKFEEMTQYRTQGPTTTIGAQRSFYTTRTIPAKNDKPLLLSNVGDYDFEAFTHAYAEEQSLKSKHNESIYSQKNKSYMEQPQKAFSLTEYDNETTPLDMLNDYLARSDRETESEVSEASDLIIDTRSSQPEPLQHSNDETSTLMDHPEPPSHYSTAYDQIDYSHYTPYQYDSHNPSTYRDVDDDDEEEWENQTDDLYDGYNQVFQFKQPSLPDQYKYLSTDQLSTLTNPPSTHHAATTASPQTIDDLYKSSEISSKLAKLRTFSQSASSPTTSPNSPIKTPKTLYRSTMANNHQQDIEALLAMEPNEGDFNN